MKQEGLTQKRDELLVTGINLLRTHAALDRDTIIRYDVRDQTAFETKVQPWINLKNDCILWHFDVRAFMQEFRVDLPIWRELVCPPLPESIQGLGAGGPYTETVIGQIEHHLKKGMDVLSQVGALNESDRENADPFVLETNNAVHTIFFKEIKDNETHYLYAINGHFEDEGRANRNKPSWKNLYRLASSIDKSCLVDNEKEAARTRDFFNFTPKNRLWSSGRWEMRKILRVVNKTRLEPYPGINLVVLNDLQWQTSVNKIRIATEKLKKSAIKKLA